MPIATPQGTLDFKSVDKVTFVGASSNTVIDTTTGSLGVGVDVNGPTSNLHVVGNTRLEGNIDMLHTANTASIKLNSNVVTEFPRSKKLIKYPRVNLTQNALNNGYAATASSENNGTSSGQAYRAFDGNAGGERGYHSAASTYSSGSYAGSASITDAHGTQHQGEWIKLQMPTTEKMKLSGFSFSPRYVSTAEYQHRAPYKGVFLGSTDGTNWYPIHYFDSVKVPELTTVSRTFENNTTDYYNHIALVAYEVGPNATYGDVLNFAEMELFGVPEYDPEAHGTDVMVKSVPNVPNTDWLEVYYDAKNFVSGSVTVQDETSNNRDAEMNATFDDGEIKAFSFSGAYTSNVTTSDHGLGTGDVTYTMSYWFKRTAVAGTYDYVVMLGNGGVSYSSILMWINTNQLVLDHWSAALRVPEPIKLNKWYHVAAGHKGGDTPSLENDFIYIDGKRVTPLITQTAGPFTLTGSKLTLGSEHNGTTEFLNGKIANFRLFNRALTSDEVWQLYAYQKEYFGHGDLSMTFKAGRLGIGTSEPRAALDVRGNIHAIGSVNPVIGMWKQTVDSATVTTTIVVNIGSCMSTKTPDGYGTATGFSGKAGIFIAPYDGIYQFQAFLIGQSGSSNCLLVFNANGPSVINGTWGTKNIIGDYREVFDLRGSRTDAEEPFTFATLLNMSKGDYVDIQNHSTGYLGHETVNCSAYLIHRFN